jgi:hypothetical protein
LTAGLTACGESTPGTTTPTQSVSPASQTAAAGYEIAIFKNGVKTGSVTGAQVNTLARVSVTVDVKAQEGPTLLSVLALAGVIDFTQITVKGLAKGRIAEAELTLKRAQVDNTVIMDINNRGETKLTGPSIGDNSAIIDVKELRIT